MLEIWQGLNACLNNMERAALATIIDVEGSAYRRESTRCLIVESGTIIGAISGGCVEGDLQEHARTMWETGAPMMLHYDFRTEEDLVWGLGVGCNGAMTIWLQPFDPEGRPDEAQAMIGEFHRRLTCTESYTTGVVLETDDPAALPIGSSVSLSTISGAAGLIDRIVNGISVKLFVETSRPRPRLLVIGAGADAVPLVSGAKALHWHVTLADHREDYLNRECFQAADQRVLASRGTYSECCVKEGDYVVVMTHHYETDRQLVQRLLGLPIRYLGVLGSRKRMERMLAEFRLNAGWNEEALEKLHAPVGLDIGAESPEEIALSILCELLSRRNGRSGQPLRSREAPLHSRQSTGSLRLATQ
ncbi:XdhC family protein [Paenibacillus sp. sgz302251]|uniref:XdhC family protein n=1 Tax=Paenibacillus sp. sgz302251 TaxID=3414493 RepID=UPI003C7B9C0B